MSVKGWSPGFPLGMTCSLNTPNDPAERCELRERPAPAGCYTFPSMFKVLNPYLKKMVDIAVLYWRQYPRIVTHIGEHRIGTFSFLDQGDKWNRSERYGARGLMGDRLGCSEIAESRDTILIF